MIQRTKPSERTVDTEYQFRRRKNAPPEKADLAGLAFSVRESPEILQKL
jgi:hypothetical protein